jgi:hypothetical protein
VRRQVARLIHRAIAGIGTTALPLGANVASCAGATHCPIGTALSIGHRGDASAAGITATGRAVGGSALIDAAPAGTSLGSTANGAGSSARSAICR